VPSPKGNRSIKGYLVRPISADTRCETVTKLPGVIVVHENRGLNPHIEDIARRLALSTSWHLRRTDSLLWAAVLATTTKVARCSNEIDQNKMSEDMVAATPRLRKNTGQR
jgi:carboxymethylenebutenolidase